MTDTDKLADQQLADRDFARMLLHRVQTHLDSQAIIAGGWARDTFLQRTPKDIDVWFYTSLSWNTVLKRMQASVLPEDVYVTVLEASSDAARGWARFIMKCTWLGHAVDFICFHKPVGQDGEHVIAQFDIGLCAIAWDGDKYITSSAFEHDHTQKTLTFNAEARGLEDLPRVVFNHLPRLRAKFPDHEPQGFPDVPEPTAQTIADFKVCYD